MGPGATALAQSSYGQEGQQLGLPDMVDPGEFSRSTGKSFGSDRQGGQTLQDQRKNQLPTSERFPSQQQMPMMGITYQVHILGEVQKPGTYRVVASTRLSEALQMAGGILEQRGSERRIELRRRDGGGRRVDLLSFKQNGNLDANPYLLDNDVIFVPLRDRVVEIEGAVKRGGYYELTSERNLEDLLKLAGGLTEGAKRAGPIKVIRFEDGAKQLLEVEDDQVSRRNFILKNADAVVVPHIFTEGKKFDYNLGKLPGEKTVFYPSYEERVFVLGAVWRPGPYAFSPYYDVRQYLTIAGGTTKLAKLKKIKVITAEGKAIKASNTTSINPGDTIVVPEKYMAPESFATLVIGIASSIVGITSAVVVLTR